MTTAGANQVAELRYFAWGETRYTNGNTPTQRRYTGQLEAEAGLYFYNARFYDSYLNRWAQPDSIVPDPSTPINYDRYAYVNNNPIKNNDPSGHMTWDGCTGDVGGCGDANIYADYVFNVWHTDQERQQNQENLEKIIDGGATVISTVYDPADWMITAAYCVSGECSPWSVIFAMAPIVPSSAGKYVEKIVELTGQFHHVFSKKILTALNSHETLSGIFKRNDLIVQALDYASHRGYQEWHRLHDQEVVNWLNNNPKASVDQFLFFIQIVYNRTDMQNRFPHAAETIQKMIEGLK